MTAMSQDAPAPETFRSTDLVSAPAPSLRGRWLLVARSVWLLLASGLLADVVVFIPTFFRLQQTICTTDLAECSFNSLPTPGTVRVLQQLGLSLPVYAIYATIVAMALPLVYWSVGADSAAVRV
jgi:hypothetical protein